MTQDKHSPLPWRLNKERIVAYPRSLEANVFSIYQIDDLERAGNRALVIKAVNNHYQLIEALESIANNTCCGGCQEAALVARQALSSAKGGDDEAN